jgi:hypothetical protein
MAESMHDRICGTKNLTNKVWKTHCQARGNAKAGDFKESALVLPRAKLKQFLHRLYYDKAHIHEVAQKDRE